MSDDAARIEMDELPENQDAIQDLLPEQIRYKDEGCDLAGSCLKCPYEECIYDKPGGKRHWMKEERSAEMIRLYLREGRTVRELADIFSVSKRTVQRALKKTRELNRRVQE